MSDFGQSYRTTKPPIYPKIQKASTIRRQTSRNSLRPSSKKHQRDQESTNKPSQTPKSHQILQSLASIQYNLHSPKQMPPIRPRQEQRNTQYQRYTRRNYHNEKNRFNEVQVKRQSRLTQNIISNRSLSKQEQKRSKSKSALNYAKYFIRQLSINQQNNPSSTSQTNQQMHHPINKQKQQTNPQLQQQKTKNIIQKDPQNEQKRESRTKLTQRLKSLKRLKTRTKQKASSIQKNRVSKQKKALNEQSDKPIGNMVSLSDQQYNILRKKARKRNEKIMIKIKKLNSNYKLHSENFCLEMSSKIDKSFSQRKECFQKIELHLEILNHIPSYVKQFKQIYEQTQCWEELIFLVYKKFYIQRLKVQYALGFNQNVSQISSTNPFKFQFCQINNSDLLDFKNTLQSMRMQARICQQNKKIQSALRNLYNHIIQKSGYHINLMQKDNFSQQIYLLMNQQLKLLQESQNYNDMQVRIKRMGFIMKVSLMIAYLNGEIDYNDNFLSENCFSQMLYQKYKKFIRIYIEE